MSGISTLSTTRKKPLILVADDDKTVRHLLREAMEKEGYLVVEVHNGQECLDVYAELKPDLILMDAIMPIMDGFTCCDRLTQILRNNLALAVANFDSDSSVGSNVISNLWDRTPILMITSLEDPESVDRAFAAGANDYVTKPIHWAVLRQRVRRLLQQAQLYKQLESANRALQELANVDGLTGVANRRRFDQYLNSTWMNLAQKRSPTAGTHVPSPLSLILCDIDFFKLYNDKYGHPAGDLCLQKVAGVLRGTAQKSPDLVARYGGEEFAVIMPNTNSPGAVHIGAAMQAGIREQKIAHTGSSVSKYVTLSLGVATIIPDLESSATPQTLIETADKALYQAKAEGRNRIILKQVNSNRADGGT